MTTPAEFLLAITDWSTDATKAHAASQARNYKQFQRAFRSGSRRFQIISKGIRQNLHESITAEKRDQLEQAARNWDQLGEAMETWKNELHASFQQEKRAASRGKRLSKGYGLKHSKPGQNLRLNAT